MNFKYKKRIIFLLVAFFVIILSYFFSKRGVEKTLVEIYFTKQAFSISAELAITQQEQRTGLMYREKMEKDRGMLFVFKDEVERNFWMKNTKIPLDIIFIGKNQKIVDIKEAFDPCLVTICPTYKSIAPAYYVLEVNTGLVREKDLKVGDELKVVIK